MPENLVAYLVPIVVAILTAIGATSGIQFRDGDTYQRRRGLWLWMLVALSAVATASAMNSASGIGRPLAATLTAAAAIVAVIAAHLLWRHVVLAVQPRNANLAMAGAGLAIVVIVASVTMTYVSGKGCRQAVGLMNSGVTQANLILPSFGAPQGPPLAQFQDWADATGKQADQVTDSDLAPHAKRLAELAQQITDTVQTNDPGQHAVLGAQFYDELKALLIKCDRR